MFSPERKYDIVSRCLQRWNADDSRTAYFESNFDEWIDQIPEEIQQIVVDLLGDFEYFSQPQVNSFLSNLHQKLLSFPNFEPDKALYTYIPSKKGIENSSIDYLLNYKNIHQISKFQLATDFNRYIKARAREYAEKRHVVVVDDYCGSGDSFITFLSEHASDLSEKTVYYVVTYTMSAALKRITDFAQTQSISVNIVFINQGIKAFERPQFSDNAEFIRTEFKSAASQLQLKSTFSLGYSECEALVSFYNDTPNNTLGLFWCDTPIYFSIFPRESEHPENKKRPTPQTMKSQKAVRNTQNYITKKRSVSNG